MTTTTTGLPSAEVTRPRTVLVATMFASAAAFMAFAGVLLVYINERASAETWSPGLTRTSTSRPGDEAKMATASRGSTVNEQSTW